MALSSDLAIDPAPNQNCAPDSLPDIVQAIGLDMASALTPPTSSVKVSLCLSDMISAGPSHSCTTLAYSQNHLPLSLASGMT